MRALALLLAAVLWCGMIHAEVPHKLNYQGYLTTSGGQPVNSSLSMELRLYNVPSDGMALFVETQSVTVTDGVFNVLLGTAPSLDLEFDVPYYLGISVGGDPEMTPRQLVTASPYARRSAIADALAPAATVAGAQITGTIVTAQIADGAVTTAKLASAAVTTASLADGSVSAAKLASSGCASGQVLKYNGVAMAWACAFDNDTISGGTVTSLTAGAGLTGGTITTSGTIGLGTVPVANGGTGQTSLGANGILYGQGTGAVGVAAGAAGQVLAGTAGAPAWTGSPSLSGSLTLVNPSSASAGNIMKGANRFVHNFGSENTFIGKSAGNFTMTGAGNTASGEIALSSITTGYNNTASGAAALQFNTTGYQNVASGRGALYSNTSGNSNTAGGTFALYSNTSGDENTASGRSALLNNTTGSSNTASGAAALLSNTTGSFNTASGADALGSNTTGYRNTASGWQALWLNTEGYYNTASGALALNSNLSGTNNTASGALALRLNTTGSNNTASGYQALYHNVSGYENTASGVEALASNVQGFRNTALGFRAMYLGNGAYNTAVGNEAMANGPGGEDNSAIGYKALNGNVQGNRNTASGSYTLEQSTGDNNTGLGYAAGLYLTAGSGNIYLGNEGVSAESNTIRIGSGGVIGNQNRFFVAGVRGVATGAANAVSVLIDSNGQLGTASSSRRFKDDIADMDAASGPLMKLRPVTFHYKSDRNPTGRALQYGLIAEEVAEVYPGLVAHSANGQIETVMYQFLPPMLLNEFQKQQRTITGQLAEMARQAAALNRQATRVTELERDRHAQAARIDALEQRMLDLVATMRQAANTTRIPRQAAVLDRLAEAPVPQEPAGLAAAR